MIKEIKLDEKFVIYLSKRKLLSQYLKAEQFILSWKPKQANLRLRQPKSKWIYYFRINEQFRAIWKVKNGILEITQISNHSN